MQDFKEHELFGQDSLSLVLHCYYDDFQVTNPLGAKTKKHKIGIRSTCIYIPTHPHTYIHICIHIHMHSYILIHKLRQVIIIIIIKCIKNRYVIWLTTRFTFSKWAQALLLIFRMQGSARAGMYPTQSHQQCQRSLV